MTTRPGLRRRDPAGPRAGRPEASPTLTVTGLDPDRFEVRVETAPDAGSALPGTTAVTVTVTCRSGAPVEARLRVTARIGAAEEPTWLIPGLFYGENRPADNHRLYPRFARTVDEPADPDRFVAPGWSFRADRAATPVAFAWGADGGVALAAAHIGPLGLTGIGFAHEGDVAAVHADFPYREEPVSYVGEREPAPPLEERHRWRPGERRVFRLRLYRLPPDRHAYAPVLRELYARGLPAGGAPVGAEPPAPPADARTGPVAWVSVAEAADLAAYGLHRWHYRPDPPVLLETAAFDRELNAGVGGRGDRAAMHVAWVSGIPYAYALLAHGRRRGVDAYAAAGAAVIDHVCANLAPGGTFWGKWSAERGWSKSWTPVPHGLHARTLAEATVFCHRAARAERESAAHPRPAWEKAVRANLDVAVRNQRADGNLGSLIHAQRGEVLTWAGAAGLTWVAALAEAADLDPAYLVAARRGGAYYARFVEGEALCGAPEDVDRAPTSEDGYAAVLAYMALWRATGEARWLELARRAADWMLTFRYSYDVVFDEHTLLGRYGFRTRGADQASPSNQHLHAYGLICLAEMVELAAAVDDPYYLDRTRENLACFRQFIARADGDFNAYKGMASERYYQTACFQAKGMVLTLSHAWSVGVLLLGCEAALRHPEVDW